jgi:hypothetical protein
MTDLTALAAPFPDAQISWRVGSTTGIDKKTNEPYPGKEAKGMALAYIDARDVMRRLDEACGPACWQCEYTPMPNGTTCCRIAVRTVSGEWVWKANGGSATGDVEKEAEREMAEKGGYSDAFKRAAVLWGIGRYLYELDSPWIALEKKGNSWVFPKNARADLDRAHQNFVKRLGRSEAASGAGVSPPASAPEANLTEASGSDKEDADRLIASMRKRTTIADLESFMGKQARYLHGLKERNPRLYQSVQDENIKHRAQIAADAEFRGGPSMQAAE